MTLDLASDGDVARDDDGVPTWGARFDTALRGYDRTQVDHYVEELTQRVIVLRSAVSGAEAAAREAHAETVRLSAELAETRSRLAMVQGGIPLDTGGAQRLMQLAVETAEGLRAEAAAIAAATQAEAHAALEAAQHERTALLESAAVEKAAILDEARRTAVALAEAGRVTADARRAEGASSRKRAEQAAKKDAQKILASATAQLADLERILERRRTEAELQSLGAASRGHAKVAASAARIRALATQTLAQARERAADSDAKAVARAEALVVAAAEEHDAATADRTQAAAARKSAAALLAAAEQAAEERAREALADVEGELEVMRAQVQATRAELAQSRDAIAAVHDQHEAAMVASRAILANLTALAGDLASAGAEPPAQPGATGLDIHATPKEDGASP